MTAAELLVQLWCSGPFAAGPLAVLTAGTLIACGLVNLFIRSSDELPDCAGTDGAPRVRSAT